MPAIDIQSASQVDAALERIVRHAFEVMCFTEAERLPSLPPLRHPIVARVHFSGGQAGYLQMEVASAAAGVLTAAFLGLEPWHPSLERYTQDAMREFARIVCGRLITSLDPSVPFEIKPAAAGSGEPCETIQQAFRLPAGMLRITLQIA